MLVKNFDGHLVVLVVLVVRHKYSSESSHPENFGLGVDNIILLQLADALLLTAVDC